MNTSKRMVFFGLAVVAMTNVLMSTTAWANSAQERLAKEYLEAAVKGDPEGTLSFYHPNEIEDLRTRVLRVLEEEAAKGGNTIRRNVLGAVASLEGARRVTPANFFLTLARRVGSPAEKVEVVKPLGTIEENSQLAHVVVRLVPPKDSGLRSRTATISLIKYGKDWRVALPYAFQAKVDVLLEGRDDKPAAAAAASENPAEILQLLDNGSAALREGNCAAYFNEHMSPKFRTGTSSKALQTLIAQCKKSEDTRETYIAALQIAKRLSPSYENNGTRAVYDMNGQGLPFQRFVLEKSGERWYVAE
jgi:hypothetical protein